MAGNMPCASADCQIDKVIYPVGDMLNFNSAQIAVIGNGRVFVANLFLCHCVFL